MAYALGSHKHIAMNTVGSNATIYIMWCWNPKSDKWFHCWKSCTENTEHWSQPACRWLT